MDINQIVKDHFGGSNAKAARALGVTRAAVHLWRTNGLPPLRRYHIEAYLKNAADAAATGESPPQKASLPAE